jgi:hypothetical protein
MTFSTTFFPEKGVFVALTNYDILFFNPQKLHCVASRKNTSNDKSNDIYCVSFYLKTAVVGGNDNNLDLTVEQVKIAQTMLNKKYSFKVKLIFDTNSNLTCNLLLGDPLECIYDPGFMSLQKITFMMVPMH